MSINFVDQANAANQYTTPPRVMCSAGTQPRGFRGWPNLCFAPPPKKKYNKHHFSSYHFAICIALFPAVTFQIHSPVADVVTRPVTTELHRNLGWHSVVFSLAAPVGHELGRATRVLFVEVRPHQSAPPPTALAESTREDSVQACCSRVQVSARDSTAVSRR